MNMEELLCNARSKTHVTPCQGVIKGGICKKNVDFKLMIVPVSGVQCFLVLIICKMCNNCVQQQQQQLISMNFSNLFMVSAAEMSRENDLKIILYFVLKKYIFICFSPLPDTFH